MNAVDIDHVTKTFGTITAVNDLSLHVPENTIYGFIGPNGSGKTTTLRMIMRILHPDSGDITVLGDKSLSSAHDEVGYLPVERGLYKQMKVKEILRFYAELKGSANHQSSIDYWLERMGLTDRQDKKVETLSKGLSQKVKFIATVVSNPKLVLLDEPFSGLDPVNAEVLRESVLHLKKQGTTIIFSTHDMSVAEKMCDFIFMIYKGKKVLDGTLESIQDTYGSDMLQVRLDGNDEPLDDVPGVLKATDHGKFQELRLDNSADTQQILAALMQRGTVRLFQLARPSLHEIFVRIAVPEPEDTNHHA
jgi:ABC-2 type transport system ATP-binding protein